MYETYKVLLLGDCSSGKTSLIYRLVYDSFLENYISTVGMDFNIKSFNVNNKNIRLQIWDSCGQERFNALTRSYYRNTHVFVICYDITSNVSFENAKIWIKEVEKYVDRPVIKMLIGTKSDLEELRRVSYNDGKKYADSLNIKFYETSSKDNSKDISKESIKQIFENVSIELSKFENKKEDRNVLQFKEYKKDDKKMCC